MADKISLTISALSAVVMFVICIVRDDYVAAGLFFGSMTLIELWSQHKEEE